MRIDRIATTTIEEFPNLLFVEIETSDGVVGLGETYYGARTVESYIHESAASRLIGHEIGNPQDLQAQLRGYVGRGGSGAETRGLAAIDIAFWDALGKLEGRSLAALVAPDPRPSIPVYNTCAGPAYVRASTYQQTSNWGMPEQTATSVYEDLELALADAGALAESLLAQGITMMKIWPFDRAAERNSGRQISDEELAKALEPLQKVRASVGDRMGIKVELHGLWQSPAIDRILAALEPFEPMWVEDPVDTLDVWELARLTASTSIPIATGETLAGTAAYRHLCERRGADVVICDVGWAGGVTTVLEIEALAREAELPLALHDCTGPVGLGVAAGLSCALPSIAVQEFTRAFYFGWYPLFVEGLPVFDSGHLVRPDAPGHGLRLVPDLGLRPGVHVTTSTAARP